VVVTQWNTTSASRPSASNSNESLAFEPGQSAGAQYSSWLST